MLKILIVMAAGAERDLSTLETRFQMKAKFRRAGDLDTAIDYLDRGDVSCILLDSAFTEVGRDAYGTLRQHFAEVPLLLLVGKDGHTRMLDLDGGMSGHIEYGEGDEGDEVIFDRVVSIVARFHPEAVPPSLDRLGPDATTKPPRIRPPPVDILEAITSPTAEREEPVEDLSSRVRALEKLAAEEMRHLRFLTWVVAVLVTLAVVGLLRT